MSWSMRNRVMLTSGLVLGLALGGSGLVVYGLVSSALNKSFDASLATQVRALSSMVTVEVPSGNLLLQTAPEVKVDTSTLPKLFEIMADGHKGIRQTTAISDATLPHPGGGTATEPKIHQTLLPNGRSGRLATARLEVAVVDYHKIYEEREKKVHQAIEIKKLQKQVDQMKASGEIIDGKEIKYNGYDEYGHKFRYKVNKEGHVVVDQKDSEQKDIEQKEAETTGMVKKHPQVLVDVVVAQETTELDNELAQIFWRMILVTGFALVISEGLMAWAMSRSLRPLNRLAKAIAKMGEKDLTQQINLKNAPRELEPVVDRLNELLERIASVLTRERGFSSDVSHELRTPLSGLLSTIDVCLRKQRDPESYHNAMTICRRITRQMQGVVVNLLELTRLESGSVKVQCEPVDLHRLISSQWLLFTERATVKQVTVKWKLAQGLALTNSDYLSQIITNLFDNAVSYVNEGGTIIISLEERRGQQCLQIANTGSLIAQEQVEQVFEKFWRADRARADLHQHCGLGLTLCRRLASVLGGNIRVTSKLGGMFVIELILPTADLDGNDDDSCAQGTVAIPAPDTPPVKRESIRKPAITTNTSASTRRRAVHGSRPGR
jgi:signal transduction histidine kinase